MTLGCCSTAAPGVCGRAGRAAPAAVLGARAQARPRPGTSAITMSIATRTVMSVSRRCRRLPRHSLAKYGRFTDPPGTRRRRASRDSLTDHAGKCRVVTHDDVAGAAQSSARRPIPATGLPDRRRYRDKARSAQRRGHRRSESASRRPARLHRAGSRIAGRRARSLVPHRSARPRHYPPNFTQMRHESQRLCRASVPRLSGSRQSPRPERPNLSAGGTLQFRDRRRAPAFTAFA